MIDDRGTINRSQLHFSHMVPSRFGESSRLRCDIGIPMERTFATLSVFRVEASASNYRSRPPIQPRTVAVLSERQGSPWNSYARCNVCLSSELNGGE